MTGTPPGLGEAAALTRLTEVFRAAFGRPGLVLDPAWTAADVDGWDSLRHVEIILRTEAAFGIRLEAAEQEGLRGVADLLALVRAKAPAAAAGPFAAS